MEGVVIQGTRLDQTEVSLTFEKLCDEYGVGITLGEREGFWRMKAHFKKGSKVEKLN